ncbi:hypothetical protein C8F01DRAFT_1372411, partial [Mycena amicta]
MPLPRLLKKLSEKSLKKRKRNQSTTSVDAQQPPTIPRTAASDVSFGELISGTGTRTPNGSYRSTELDKSTPPTPIINGYIVPNGAPPLPPPPLPPPIIEVSIPQDELSISLQGAWKSANTDPKMSKGDKILQTVENGAVAAMGKEAQGASIIAGIKIGLDAVGGLEGIEKGINAFMEGMPVLMNALDEVAKLHPFIGVAVMAFKAVWALEQKRRENDRKILMLHMEMKDMMGVLTQLKSVKDSDEVAPDGSTIKGRMQIIIETTAKDIKNCANACDTYVKKKLVVKVLKGPIWEGKLAAFAGVFTKRRTEFEFAMSMHTALGVDAANRGISVVDERTQAMNDKIDMMMKMFAQMVSPEQKEMARFIDQKGGAACVSDDKALGELNEFENKTFGGSQSAAGTKLGAKTGDLADLKDDLHTSLDEAIEANMEKFSRKFAVQQRQIIDEVSKAVERTGDRIIGAVLAGPHDRILDPNVHAVWKEMGWRGSVKTRHFVMGLRDHFQDYHHHKASEHKNDGEGRNDAEKPDNAQEFVPPIAKEDEWTLDFINVVRLQAISEAFDDDASGFITVAESNAFTTARPLDWSISRWIAYWAVGHHQTMQVYVNKIKELLGKMFAILPAIPANNKSAVNDYLKKIYEGVYSITSSLNYCYINTALQEKFQSYVASEEERIRGNLEAIRYDIDASDTLELVTGEGRIERYVLPVMYLLLKRHLEIFRVCQTHSIHPDEFFDGADTMEYVFQAVRDRLELLQSIFKQQKLDVSQQFKSFSFGLYEHMNSPELIWAAKVVQETEFVEYIYDESVEDPLPDVEQITNFPLDQEPLDFAAYALPPPSDLDTTVEVLPAFTSLLSARWHGFIYNSPKQLYPTAGMVSMTLKPTSLEGQVQRFATSERANKSDFKITGECRIGGDPNKILVTFQRTFSVRFSPQHYNGIWDTVTNTLSGTVGFEADVSTHFGAFIFKQVDPQYLCFMPAPVELEPDAESPNTKARALWSFAISAVRFQVRRERWSWAFFKERRDNRKRFVELYIRGEGSTQFGKPLDFEEREELSRLKKSFTTLDSRFAHSLAERQIRAMTDHGAYCDSCAGLIGGARVSCLVCQVAGGRRWLPVVVGGRWWPAVTTSDHE